MKANLIMGAVHFEADESNPRLLHFKDHILARPETNKNKDTVDEAGIKELADTISGMPLDLDHNPQKNVGFFTAGRVGSDGELRVDGAIWLDRCEENGVSTQDVLDGRYGMSIEADGVNAECSRCHGTYSHESQYCEHIRVQNNDQGIRAKIKHGAERIMRGLRAMGGAFTYKPAGSNTGADALSGMSFVASHYEVAMNDNEVEAVDKREDVTPADKKQAEKEYGDVTYADEKNKKYPIDSESHVKSALAYLSIPKNAAKYSAEEVASMMGKIRRAAKKFGIEVSDKPNKETAMDEKEKEALKKEEETETLKEEKKETAAKEKKEKEAGVEKEHDMKAEYEAMKATLADMTTKLEAATQEKATVESTLQAVKAQLTEASNKIVAHETSLKAYKVNDLKSKLVGSVMDEEEFNTKQDTLLGTPAEVIELMTRNKKETKSPDGRLPMAANEAQATVTWTLC